MENGGRLDNETPSVSVARTDYYDSLAAFPLMLFIQWPVFCWDKKPTLLLVFISFLSRSLWLSLSVCFFFLQDWKVYMRDEECLSGCALCCGGWKTSPLTRRKFPAHRGACHIHNMPSLCWKSPSCLHTRRDRASCRTFYSSEYLSV